jgi:hypothetical protein
METGLNHPAEAEFPLEDKAESYPAIKMQRSASFLDRFMRAVQRLPVPYWVTYLSLFILESLLLHILAWQVGWLPTYQIDPLVFLFPLWLWGPFTIITYLNGIAREALAAFATLLDLSEGQVRELTDEFTTMPNRAVVLSGVVWAWIYFGFTYAAYRSFYVNYGLGPLLTGVLIGTGLVTYSLGSIIYYHSLRQLQLVHRTMKMVKHFNLFHLDPVYSFSQVTSRTGIAWVILLTLTLLTFPIRLAAAPMLILLALQVILAISAFVLPLQVVHRRLVLEKRILMADHQRQVETAIKRLHRNVESNELAEMVQLNSALTGLTTEREMLNKIPTWPWRAGMLKDFLSITVLPIILFLVQFGLGKWLGK